MVQVIGLIFIVTIIIFLYLKNKQANRTINRHNRLAEKQEELIQMLKEKNNTNEN